MGSGRADGGKVGSQVGAGEADRTPARVGGVRDLDDDKMILMTLEGVWRAGGVQGVRRSPVQWAGADQPHGLAQQVCDLRDPAGAASSDLEWDGRVGGRTGGAVGRMVVQLLAGMPLGVV